MCEGGRGSLDVPRSEVSVSESSSHEVVHAAGDLTGNKHQVLCGESLLVEEMTQ